MRRDQSKTEQPSDWQADLIAELDRTTNGQLYVGNAEIVAVLSESDPMRIYYVLIFPEGRVCTCDGFRYRNNCKHVQRVRF